MKKKWILLGLSVVTVVLLLAAGRKASSKTLIVLDSGHGGKDPGKVGIAGSKEKDINLEISERVKKILEQNGYEVVMTRTDDSKVGLKERVAIIEEYVPRLVISIHQNSYPSTRVKGAQVFYYTDSEEGKKLAEIMQQSVKDKLKDGNNRIAKGNRNYYLLSHTTVPLAIVECGFLSCPEEERMLKSPEYQQKMAEAVGEGVDKYLE